jgi:ribosomal protein S18 acetylase RimI-like enzyme
MAITFQSALHMSLPAIAEIHTRAYGTSWVSTPEKLADIFRIQSVDLDLSLIASDGRKSVGLALLGRRRAHGWLYDSAVAPAYRGAGLGTRLLTMATREAAKRGVRDIELDVWEKRTDAIRLYQRVGFEHTRTYLIFEVTGAQLKLGDHDIPDAWAVRPCTVEGIIPWYAAGQNEPHPCWDRQLPSLLTYGDARACQLFDGDEAVACMHYAARTADARDPNRIRPMFIGLRPGTTVAHLRALLAATARDSFPELSTTSFRLALEPETSTLAQLFLEAQIPVVGRALDMRLRLT